MVVDPSRLGGDLRAALPATLGKVTLRVPRTPVELLVVAPGYRTQRVRGIDRDVTVRLHPGLKVDLRVKLPGGWLKFDQHLFPEIRRYDPANPDPDPWSKNALYLRGKGSTWHPSRHPWLWNQRRPLGRDGRLVFRVPSPGRYAIEWEVRDTGFRELSARARRLFTVRETSAVTRVDVELSAADLR